MSESEDRLRGVWVVVALAVILAVAGYVIVSNATGGPG